MAWPVINVFAFIVAPAALVWGWLVYLKTPDRRTWRMRASLLGLVGPALSVVVWVVGVAVANMNSELHRMLPNFVAVGTWIPILGTFVGILGRPKIAFATILASAGTILFWFGTTLP